MAIRQHSIVDRDFGSDKLFECNTYVMVSIHKDNWLSVSKLCTLLISLSLLLMPYGAKRPNGVLTV